MARTGNDFTRVMTLLSGLAFTSLAQGENRTGLEEIIVTANKREASLMQTAASVCAFDSDSMQLLGIEGSRDLVARTPSLTITTFRVAIRGVGRPNLAVGSEPGIGIYWDGVYNTENGVFNYSEFMDIERIEVLRGPQGTLYGRNSIGGAINFISKRPTEDWGTKLTGEATNFNGYMWQGYTSGPLTDDLGFLAGISKLKRDGFQDNIYNGKDYEQNDILYGTFGFEYQPTDRWNTNLKVVGNDRNQRQGNGYIREPFNRELVQQFTDVETGDLLNLPGMFASQNFVNMRQGLAVENPALRNEDKVKQDRDPDMDTQSWSAFLNSEYSADTFSLKYTGGYSRYWFDTVSDADASVASDSGVDWSQLNFVGTPVSQIPDLAFLQDNPVTPADMTWNVDQEARFTSHELQYSSNWDSDLGLLAGLYYYHSDEEQVAFFREFNDDLIEVYRYFSQFVPGTVSDDNYLYRGRANVDTRSYATYGQLNWNWTDSTVLTGGLRYSYDEKKGNDKTFVQYVGDPEDPGVNRAEDDDWDKVTWRLGVDHFLTEAHFLYGFIATGYRSGGFNFQKPTSKTMVDVVSPEEITSYEVGYKGVMWDNRLNLSASAYYYDYEDLQVLKQDVVEGIGLNTFVNADEAEAWGIELETQALVTRQLLLSGTYSWNDSEYDKFLTKDANACQLGPLSAGMGQAPLCTEDLDLSGNQFPLMPEHKVSANITYFWELFDFDWAATLSYFYTDEHWATPFNNPLYDEVGSFDAWDARLSATSPDQAWEVTAWVKNIEDDRELVGIARPSTVTQNAQSSLQAPRTYGLRLSYSF
jgi:iron complex outermembrane receptor protein